MCVCVGGGGGTEFNPLQRTDYEGTESHRKGGFPPDGRGKRMILNREFNWTIRHPKKRQEWKNDSWNEREGGGEGERVGTYRKAILS
jgi:hypothetical protein